MHLFDGGGQHDPATLGAAKLDRLRAQRQGHSIALARAAMAVFVKPSGFVRQESAIRISGASTVAENMFSVPTKFATKRVVGRL
jgi:hypothetical protein